MDSRRIFDEKISGFFRAANASRFPNPLSAPGRRLLGSALFQAGQARRRGRHEAEDLTVPPILIASVTRACNLNCVGCYSKALRQGEAAELSDERFLEIFREGMELGVGTIMVAGGEPLMRRGLLERMAKLPGLLIPVFTNGTLIDASFAGLAARSGIVPILSIEGEASFTAARRGAGVHEGALKAMDLLKSRGALYGASITLSSRNADLVLSREFLESLEGLGISVLFLVEYVPAAPGTEDLVLRDEQKAKLLEPETFRSLAFPHVSLPGDEEAFGGCLAAGRGFLHIAETGRLEACPFAPYSDTGVATRSLREALASPLMKAIRERHAELTETKGGCALWNKGGWVAGLGVCAARGAETDAPPMDSPAGGPVDEALRAEGSAA